MANVWFSTYKEGPSPKLAAIIGEIAEETAVASSSTAEAGRESNIPLGSRELDVIRLLIQGSTNKEIAAKLEISESVVKNTFQQLFSKSGVRTRSQLVRVILEHYRDYL